jgi:glycosyltransferase involved in cell wall biosynthesis
MADAHTNPPAPPPVGHVLHVVGADVAQRFRPMLAQALPGLSTTGIRCSLLTDDLEMVQRLDDSPVECHWVQRLTGWQAWNLAGILALRFRPPPDLVHVWGTVGLSTIQRWAGVAHLPVVIYATGADDVERVMRSGLRSNQWLVEAANALAGPILEGHPQMAARCRILPPAVAPPVRPTRERDPQAILSVLCVSKLEAHFGIEVLIDAVAQLHHRGAELQVGILGTGRAVGPLWRRMRDGGIGDSLSIIDDADLWERVVPDIDVCVVPGRQHAIHVAPLLAMGLGRLVITSRDQLAEWFVEEGNCWQFTPGSVVELAYLLARASEQPKQVRQLGEQAADYVRAHHAMGDFVAGLCVIYRDVVEMRAAAVQDVEEDSVVDEPE